MNTVGFLCTLGLMAAFSCLADGGTAIALSDDDVTAIVDKHNQLRSNVTPSATNMLKMTWNEEAAKNARDVAKTCPEEHSTYSARKVGTIFCGENIFVSTHEINLKEAIQAWYNEVRNFDFTTQPLNEEQKMALLKLVGHYTQVVWHNSKEIGCAQVFCPDLELPYILVCHYCPAGNTDITKPYETGKSCEKCPNHCEDNLCTKEPCPYNPDLFRNCKDLKKYCYHPFIYTFCATTCFCKAKK